MFLMFCVCCFQCFVVLNVLCMWFSMFCCSQCFVYVVFNVLLFLMFCVCGFQCFVVLNVLCMWFSMFCVSCSHCDVRDVFDGIMCFIFLMSFVICAGRTGGE